MFTIHIIGSAAKDVLHQSNKAFVLKLPGKILDVSLLVNRKKNSVLMVVVMVH